MREGIKIIGVVSFLAVFSADLGTRTAYYVASLEPRNPRERGHSGQHNDQSSKIHGGGRALNPYTSILTFFQLDIYTVSHDENSADAKHGSGWYPSNEGWIAFGTMALVFVTGGLWRYTYKLWKTTESAIVELERPYIFIMRDVTLHAQLCDYADDDAYDIMASLHIGNYGKFPATIEDIKVSVGGIGNKPRTLGVITTYCSIPANSVIAPNNKTRKLKVHVVDDSVKTSFSGLQEGDLLNVVPVDPTNFFYWIKISYRGLPGTRFVTEGCWKWGGGGYAFARWGDKPYNEQT